uniref:uncharacterized protein LOC109970428 n=1 Tax=Monopterus albus TaxID=43700 RepID=UPI0009B45A60|nr:uncharacterized protein LOC109970428 [Monopterus albus]
MVRSQKQFSSEPQTTSLLCHQANSLVSTPLGELGSAGGVDTPAFFDPLIKQQNLPQRPTSLQLFPKTKETTTVSCRLKPGKLQLNHKQVETGVAKMNTVTVATAAEPQMVTTVTNNTKTRGSVAAGSRVHVTTVVSSGYSAGVPTLVTNAMIGGGRTNPAGPQLDEEDKIEGGMIGGEDGCLNLLNISPDEHEPLLRREHPPAESEPLSHLHHQSRAGSILSGRGSNSNNNNNRIALGSEIKIQGLEVKAEWMISSEASHGRGISSPKPELHLASQQISGSPATAPLLKNENLLLPGPVGQYTDSGTCFQKVLVEKPVLTTGHIQIPKDHLVHSTATAEVLDSRDLGSGSTNTPEVPETPTLQAWDSGPETSASSSKAVVLDTLIHAQKPSSTEALGAPAPDPETPVGNVEASTLAGPASENPAPETPVLESQDSETTTLAHVSADPPIPDLLKPQMGRPKVRRPERPCSLDLSSSYISSDEVFLTDNGSLSASGEKIKHRVKTPYTLKKWRPASWVVSTDTALDSDFDFHSSCSSSSQSHSSSGFNRAEGTDIPKINQSKSSMAVFLVSRESSKPDGMTCF